MLRFYSLRRPGEPGHSSAARRRVTHMLCDLITGSTLFCEVEVMPLILSVLGRGGQKEAHRPGLAPSAVQSLPGNGNPVSEGGLVSQGVHGQGRDGPLSSPLLPPPGLQPRMGGSEPGSRGDWFGQRLRA